MVGKSEVRALEREVSLPGFKRILVAVDGSDNSLRASRLAVGLAQKYRSELIFLNVIQMQKYTLSLADPNIPQPPGAFEKEREYERKVAREVLDRATRLADQSGLNVRSEIQEALDSIVEAITEYARGEKADLIVVGTRGLSRFKKLVLGSVSSGVVNHAHCPVLVVR